MANSKIEWTEATWNPVTGCTKVSAGCKNCYAETMAARLQAMGQRNYANGFKLTLQPRMLDLPVQWKRPRLIFVNSMSDLFHDEVSVDYIQQVWGIMVRAGHHTYQVLTKRSKRLAEVAPLLPRLGPIWVGVSVEDSRVSERIDDLRRVSDTVARVRFLSCEPLLGPLPNLDLTGIGWVIVGGESGPGARPMHPDWARGIRDQCTAAGVPFFFKQWGAWMPTSVKHGHGPKVHTWPDGAQSLRVGKSDAGRTLDGRTWDEMPEVKNEPDLFH